VLADHFVVLDRGEAVMAGTGADMHGESEIELRRWMSV